MMSSPLCCPSTSRRGMVNARVRRPGPASIEDLRVELLSGGEATIRALRDSGVRHLWGYPGGAALHIYDALFRQEDVKHILMRHEQGATHAADAYARATGEVGA